MYKFFGAMTKQLKIIIMMIDKYTLSATLISSYFIKYVITLPFKNAVALKPANATIALFEKKMQLNIKIRQ